MTVDDFPLVRPAEVVACALICLDELDAICVADAALNHGDTTKEEIAELLVGRYSKAARLRLGKADAAARSHLETRTRLCLREAGLRVETGVVLEGVGEVDTLVEGWLIVEDDGFEFHSSREQFARDRNRDQTALAAGRAQRTSRLSVAPREPGLAGGRARIRATGASAGHLTGAEPAAPRSAPRRPRPRRPGCWGDPGRR